MDFVYICRNGRNEELRYSIRSVLHFYPDAKIHIFGGKPDWYSGKYTMVLDTGNKFHNINKCYENICSSDIADFVLMNDDFYIINKIDSFEYHYDGSLDEKIRSHTSQYGLSKYARVLSDANKTLRRMGITEPINYDVHTPILFNRKKLSDVISLSYAPRSMYGNIYKVGGKKILDAKVYKNTNKIDTDGPFLSSEDNSFNKIYDFLKTKFPEPTAYELDLLTTSSI